MHSELTLRITIQDSNIKDEEVKLSIVNPNASDVLTYNMQVAPHSTHERDRKGPEEEEPHGIPELPDTVAQPDTPALPTIPEEPVEAETEVSRDSKYHSDEEI